MSEERLSKAEAIAKADASWADWHAFLVGEAVAGRAELKGSDGWTLGEATAHVARWQGWALGRMRRVLDGERIERLDVDTRNAEWAEADRGVAFEPALERLENAWAALRTGAMSIPDGRWRRLISAVFAANTWEHYEEHRAWRPAAPSGR